MGAIKIKFIRTDLAILTYMLVYSGIFIDNQAKFRRRDIQAHSKTCRTMVYSEPWYIWNPDIFRIMVY